MNVDEHTQSTVEARAPVHTKADRNKNGDQMAAVPIPRQGFVAK